MALYFTMSGPPVQKETSGISWYLTLNSSGLITTDGLKVSETLGQLADYTFPYQIHLCYTDAVFKLRKWELSQNIFTSLSDDLGASVPSSNYFFSFLPHRP